MDKYSQLIESMYLSLEQDELDLPPIPGEEGEQSTDDQQTTEAPQEGETTEDQQETTQDISDITSVTQQKDAFLAGVFTTPDKVGHDKIQSLTKDVDSSNVQQIKDMLTLALDGEKDVDTEGFPYNKNM